MASYFLSDIHLRPYNDPRTKILVDFLDQVPDGTESVFFLGDIFDFWMGGHQIWVDRYRPFVEAIRRLRERNIPIFFFEGNHDIHIHPFYEKLGIQIFTEPKIFDLFGLRVRIEHGDLFNPDDRPYLFLRKFLRSWPLKTAALVAPGRVTAFVADWGTQTSHKRTSVSGRRPEVIEDIKRRTKIYFEKCSHESDFDLMIMGHTHVREDYKLQVGERVVQFINLGSWFEPEPKVLVLTQNEPPSFLKL
jgi:UDP-2,3-diacylglucosamine hydrolase